MNEKQAISSGLIAIGESHLLSIFLAFGFSGLLLAQSPAQIPDYMYSVINDAGRMSIAAYGADKQLIETLRQEGWGIPIQIDFPSGLHASVWNNILPNGNTERMVAFAGTKDIAGVAADLSQGLVGPTMTAQYSDGLDFARQQIAEKDANPRLSVTFTGHSLGGSIAELVNLDLGVRTVVFNAAPLNGLDSFLSKDRSGQASVATGDLWNLRTKGDVVSALPGIQYGRVLSFALVRPSTGQWAGDYSTHGVESLLDSIRKAQAASAERLSPMPDSMGSISLSSSNAPKTGMPPGLASGLTNGGTLAGAVRDLIPDDKLPKSSVDLDFPSQGLKLLGAAASGDLQQWRDQWVNTSLWGLGQAGSAFAKPEAFHPIGSEWHVGQGFADHFSLLGPLQDLVSASTSQIGDRRWLPNQDEQSKYLSASHELLIADFNLQFKVATATKAFADLSSAAKVGWGANMGVTAALPDFANFATSILQNGLSRPVINGLNSQITLNQSISLLDSLAKGTSFTAAFMATGGNANFASGVSTLVGFAANSGRASTASMFVDAETKAKIADMYHDYTLSQAAHAQPAVNFENWLNPIRNRNTFSIETPVTSTRFAFTGASGHFINGMSSFSQTFTFHLGDPFEVDLTTRTSTSYTESFNGALAHTDTGRLPQSGRPLPNDAGFKDVVGSRSMVSANGVLMPVTDLKNDGPDGKADFGEIFGLAPPKP